MIDIAMTFLLSQLNAFLGAVFPANEPRAVLSSLITPDGQPASGIDNRMVLSLMNIERETAARNVTGTSPGPGPALQVSAPLNLNLYVLLSSSFSGYEVSLGFLSAAIGFLNSKPVFTPQNSPVFPRGLERLSIEMINLNNQDLQNLWATIGGKYLPSALYKLRMVTISDAWLTERVPVISGAETRV